MINSKRVPLRKNVVGLDLRFVVARSSELKMLGHVITGLTIQVYNVSSLIAEMKFEADIFITKFVSFSFSGHKFC